MAIDEILQMARQISFNHELYDLYIRAGVEYLINPNTGELHRVDPQNFFGSHNLAIADLENFIGLINVGILPAHCFKDDFALPIYDLETDKCIGTYQLNKCRHCFPPCQITDLAIPPRRPRGAAMKFTPERFAPVWNQRTMEKSLP